MELSRMGTFHKEVRKTAFSDREPSILYDAKTGSIKLSVKSADGMGAKGTYDYIVTLSSSDLKSILELLSKQRCAFKESELQQTLISSSHALLRLLIASSGVPFDVLPSETELRIAALKQKNDSDKSV
jgi:formyltetrahydrofolate hydrolase